MNTKILHLTLKKKWFDMIASGEKKEEYREGKPYWDSRLLGKDDYKYFDSIRFKNGYSKDAPTIDIQFKGISWDTGKEEWGAEKSKLYHVIVLGEIISIQNVN